MYVVGCNAVTAEKESRAGNGLFRPESQADLTLFSPRGRGVPEKGSFFHDQHCNSLINQGLTPLSRPLTPTT